MACAPTLAMGMTPKINRTRPLWADGTDLTGYVIKRDGYYGKAGTVFRASTASLKLFWSYALPTVSAATACSGRQRAASRGPWPATWDRPQAGMSVST